MAPSAPGLLSTTKRWPRLVSTPADIVRNMASETLPAANGMTTRMGLLGPTRAQAARRSGMPKCVSPPRAPLKRADSILGRPMSDDKFGVLFVCTGNICRSPTAEAIFRKLAEDAGMAGAVTADSAGTHGYHVGEPPDPRAQAAAAKRGYDLSALRARRIEGSDFQRFDLVLAMDQDHYAILARMAGSSAGHKLKLMMSYAERFKERDVPDPYYGGPQGFERVLDLLEDAASGLLRSLRKD